MQREQPDRLAHQRPARVARTVQQECSCVHACLACCACAWPDAASRFSAALPLAGHVQSARPPQLQKLSVRDCAWLEALSLADLPALEVGERGGR